MQSLKPHTPDLTPIKIAIDISPTKNANAKRGVGFYTSRLVNALREIIKTDLRYRHWQIDFIDSFSYLNPNTYSLVHYPYFDPFSPTLPRRSKIPVIVTVHDLIPLKFPRHYPKGMRGSLNWIRQRQSLKRADFIITDSHTSKYDITDIVTYPPERIYAIHLAADPIYKKLSLSSLKPHTSYLKTKYNLSSRFALYVGDINWNKNIPNLVRACESLKIPLLIAGSSTTAKNVPDHPETADLRWLQNRAIKLKRYSSNALKLLGFVSDSDLLYLYNLATLYCQPSYYEGFGLPALEAMACGCPLVYSLGGSLMEVVDYQGEFFDPWKKHDLERALKKVWEDGKYRKVLSKKGIIRAKSFSWLDTARQTLAVYQLAIK